jgi:hypothetical protein
VAQGKAEQMARFIASRFNEPLRVEDIARQIA